MLARYPEFSLLSVVKLWWLHWRAECSPRLGYKWKVTNAKRVS
jgi:hypothetical protein